MSAHTRPISPDTTALPADSTPAPACKSPAPSDTTPAAAARTLLAAARNVRKGNSSVPPTSRVRNIDGRLKTDVTNAENNLAAAMKLRPVNFRWKATGAADFGLIAQDVRRVLPSLVVGDEATESLTVNYSQLSVVAVGAIQEQQREIETLRAGAARRDADNAALSARIEQLEAAIKQLQGGK